MSRQYRQQLSTSFAFPREEEMEHIQAHFRVLTGLPPKNRPGVNISPQQHVGPQQSRRPTLSWDRTE